MFGTDKAAQSITDAQNKNIAQSEQTQQQNNQLFQPYVSSGAAAVGKQGDLLGLNGTDAQTKAYGDFQFSPDYKVRLDQGLDALDRSNLGKYGSLNNGNVLKSTVKYGEDMGTQGYNDYYSKLMGVGSQGLTASTANANSNQNASTAITGANTAIGNANANAALQDGSILSGIIGLGTQLFAPSVSSLFKPNPVATTGQKINVTGPNGLTYQW